jgi:hypothetical protein
MSQHGHNESRKNKAEAMNAFARWVYVDHHTSSVRMLGTGIYPPRHVRPSLEMRYELHCGDESRSGERRFLGHESEDSLLTLVPGKVEGNMDVELGEDSGCHMDREYHAKCPQTQVKGELD